MCEPATTIALISAAVTSASAGNQYQVAKQKDRDNAAGIRNDAVNQREADRLVQQTVDRQRLSNPDNDATSSLAQFTQQLQRTQGQANAGLNQLGGVSDRYAADAGAAKQGIADYASGQANLFSRLDAPMLQRQREGIDFSRLGSDLNRVRNASDSNRYLTGLQIASRQANPLLAGFSEANDAYIGAGGTYGGWGGSTKQKARTGP